MYECYSSCPHCGKVALSRSNPKTYALSFDACPHCMFLRWESAVSCDSMHRVEIWQGILKERGLTLAQLRSELSSVTADELGDTAFRYDTSRKANTAPYTKLGGLSLYCMDSRWYRKNYLMYYPTVRHIARSAINSLNSWLQGSAKPVERPTPTSYIDWIVHSTDQAVCSDNFPF
ncbi:hypothetical protein [Vibrio sp. Hal054]|uniref:hypothetical protein n=1 Tax=Vibrio sp. Hal054 TaxID=3035158 RepID=UPI00301BFD56